MGTNSGFYTPAGNQVQINCDGKNTGQFGSISPFGEFISSEDTTRPHYRAGAVTNTLYSTAAAVLVEIQGSATKTVRVKNITLWGQAGTKFYTELTLQRAKGLSGSGTPNAATIGLHDVNNAAATAVVNYYTAAATVGTGAALIGAKYFPLVVPSATAQMMPISWDFTQHNDQALVLRGTADVIQVFNTITSLGTATYGFEVTWAEDAS